MPSLDAHALATEIIDIAVRPRAKVDERLEAIVSLCLAYELPDGVKAPKGAEWPDRPAPVASASEPNVGVEGEDALPEPPLAA